MEQELINNEMQDLIERIKIKNTSYKRTNKWSFIFCFFVSVLLVLLVFIRRGLPNSEVTSLFAAAFPMWYDICRMKRTSRGVPLWNF